MKQTVSIVVEQALAAVPGGTGRYAQQIAAAVAERAPENWSVRGVTAWHRDTDRARIRGVQGPVRMPLGSRPLALAWQYRFPPYPRGAVIHATTPLAPLPRLFIPGSKGARPVVVTVHDTVPWSDPETLTPRGVFWHRKMIGLAADHASAVVVPTQVVADELVAIFPSLAERVSVIGHGVTSWPTISQEQTRKRLAGWRLPDKYVLSLSTLEPRKGLDILLAAMGTHGVGAAAETDLVVVGQQGWGGVSVADAATDAGFGLSRLHQLGRLSDSDLAIVLRNASVLAVPSRAEGFGLPVLEAFAAGVPVVCSDAPALVEVAGGAAEIVPRQDSAGLSNALARVLSDTAHAAHLRSEGLRRAAHFSWSQAADALWEIYRSAARR